MNYQSVATRWTYMLFARAPLALLVLLAASRAAACDPTMPWPTCVGVPSALLGHADWYEGCGMTVADVYGRIAALTDGTYGRRQPARDAARGVARELDAAESHPEDSASGVAIDWWTDCCWTDIWWADTATEAAAHARAASNNDGGADATDAAALDESDGIDPDFNYADYGSPHADTARAGKVTAFAPDDEESLAAMDCIGAALRARSARRAIIGNLSALARDSRHSTGQADALRINAENEGLRPAHTSVVATRPRRSPTYTWHEFYRTLWGGDYQTAYGMADEVLQAPAARRLEPAARYGAKVAAETAAGVASSDPANVLEADVSGLRPFLQITGRLLADLGRAIERMADATPPARQPSSSRGAAIDGNTYEWSAIRRPLTRRPASMSDYLGL